MSDRLTQQRRILNLLRSKEWVGLYEILDLRVAKYSSRITELRHQGHVIENRKERTANGTIHSWYRLVPPSDPQAVFLDQPAVQEPRQPGAAFLGKREG